MHYGIVNNVINLFILDALKDGLESLIIKKKIKRKKRKYKLNLVDQEHNSNKKVKMMAMIMKKRNKLLRKYLHFIVGLVQIAITVILKIQCLNISVIAEGLKSPGSLQ